METPVPRWWPRDTGACDSGGVSVTHESRGGGKGVLFTVGSGHGQDVNFRGPLVLTLLLSPQPTVFTVPEQQAGLGSSWRPVLSWQHFP